MDKLKDKTYNERLIYFATAPRATVKEIHQMIDGEFVRFFGGRLRGMFVKIDEWKFDTKQEALDNARKYREMCKNKAKEKGLL